MSGSDAKALRLEGLHAEVVGKEILHGVDLVIRPGEVHAREVHIVG